ncbi:CvpA family protein [Gilvimarinus sp. F26214L]|uniref:CvpA family protein n=1 Tax=Gilvimarinus sp. DZF01 TaxID=3461371 RepID=UPI0040461B69
MNWADLTILGILFVSSLISIRRGFVKEALSLAGWAAAFIIAMLFSGSLATLFANSIESPSVREMVAFAILFATTLVVAAMANYLIAEVVRMTGLSGTDRTFGMIFGLVRGLIVVMAIILLVPPIIPLDQEVWWRESSLIPHFLSMEHWSRQVAGSVIDFVVALFK